MNDNQIINILIGIGLFVVIGFIRRRGGSGFG